MPAPIAVLAPILLAAGCGHHFMPLNRAALRASSPRTIRVPTIPPVQFDGAAVKGVFIIGLPLLGVVGGLAAHQVAISMGVKAEGVNDPAMYIRFELASAIAKGFSMEIIDQRSGLADLQLDVVTTDWGVVSTASGRYGVKYAAELTLTDRRTDDVLAQSACGGFPVDRRDNPTWEQLKRAGPSRLRDMLRAAAQYCLDIFRRRTLGLNQ